MFGRSKSDIELLQASRGVPTLNDASEVPDLGRSKAFGVLVERYQSLVCAITYSATGSVERSEELAQEVFLRAWRSLGQLQDLSKFRPWLCSIARSTIQNWLRDRRRDVVSRAAPLDCAAHKTSNESGPEETAMIHEQKAVVRQALAEIPEPLREPLILFYREQKSIRAVAEQFGLTENAARQRISRGRRLLRRQVAHMVEATIARSRPGKAFTAAVVVCIAGTAVKSSAAVAVVGAAHVASAASKSVGLASLLLGVTAKIAAVAAGLALIAGGVLAYRHFTRAPEPIDQAVLAIPVAPGPAARDRPNASWAMTTPNAVSVVRAAVLGTPRAVPIPSASPPAAGQPEYTTSLAQATLARSIPVHEAGARSKEASQPGKQVAILHPVRGQGPPVEFNEPD